MKVGIDASNIRAGGGLTHLREILHATHPAAVGIDRVIVWGGHQTLAQLPERVWLERIHERELDGSALKRARWRKRVLDQRARDTDVLFVPGGLYSGSFRPYVTMSQNLLPFDPIERARFGWSPTRLRYHLLERGQTRAFRNAAGVIFLTETAKRVVESRTGPLSGNTTVIPHGLGPRFVAPPREARPLSAYSAERPFRWLYVSIVNHYKHQWYVAEAVTRLRREGLPVVLDLVGPAFPSAERRLKECLSRVDPEGAVVRYHGAVPHDEIDRIYHEADAFVFASSCENMPIIVMEAMAAGLPVASAERGPMPEVLADTAVYFDPEDPDDIARALREMMHDPGLRSRLASAAAARAQEYSWERCARETFQVIADVTRSSGVPAPHHA